MSQLAEVVLGKEKLATLVSSLVCDLISIYVSCVTWSRAVTLHTHTLQFTALHTHTLFNAFTVRRERALSR